MSYAYIYNANIYCETCGEALIDALRAKDDVDWQSGGTGDSGDWPQGPFSNGGGEADTPQHCGNGEKCLEAIEIAGLKHGAFLGNLLTRDGMDYVRDAVGSVADYWREEYSRVGYHFD